MRGQPTDRTANRNRVSAKKQGEPKFSAPKPTFDELLAGREEANRANTNFLKVDADTALTFTDIALSTEDPVKKRRNVRSARRAYDTVMRLIEKVDLSDSDGRILGAKLLSLKARLDALGEIF